MKKNRYQLEFKLFFRSSSSWIGIFVLLITGFAGLYFGKTFIARQEAVIEKAAILQKKNTLKNIEHFGDDIGLLFFHNKFTLANAPDNWAAFANGQRDINPYLISVTMLGLEGQLYDTDINNPVSLLLGNMDLSFVFIFLFPLVITAFTYNLLSEQKESGIWSLLRAQTNQSFQVIWQKFLVRVAVIFSVALLLLLAAMFYLALPQDVTFLSVTVLILLYLSFWFAVSFFFISLGKSSNFNASALIAVWVLLCIVIPASFNLFLTRKYPVPEALQNVINQREGYHEKWDMAKDVTMKPFFKHYPQLKKYPFPEKKTFSWYWYYAMQQMGDDQAFASRLAIEKKLASRQDFTDIFAFFLPTIQTQLGLNKMAGSDLATHLEFQQAVRKYHEQIRLHFYPAIFLNRDVNDTDIKDYKLEKYNRQQIPHVWINMLSVSLLTMVMIGATALNLKRFNS
ncbi:ABC-2 type transport system permease protein [Pedobacter suwonensis]|uniref:ABC-2 type transport system permease protein n=1 Tax=Pedobacter suwonensis TaxID=332999 RepID=A0A1I0TP02_9SPHI|nr:DUF3526 domain-containing protein [Pedobacter suwonensis]SFA53475.1 ABC-2 type transport system permease protein [Pedobacter suwonensis]